MSFNICKTSVLLLFPFYGCGYRGIEIKLIAESHVISK